MRDFEDEIPGYLGNDKIRRTLEDIELRSGIASLHDNMIRCYRALVAIDVVGKDEEKLLATWLDDLAKF
jgi:hypothetical protein